MFLPARVLGELSASGVKVGVLPGRFKPIAKPKKVGFRLCATMPGFRAQMPKVLSPRLKTLGAKKAA
jgi:hypothetical protein